MELFPGQRIDVFVDFDVDYDSRETVLAQAHAWVGRVHQRAPEYRTWTAEQVIEGRWNLDEPMTVEDIYLLLRLLSICCEADGSARLNWDDKDVLFGGHGFCTRLGTDGECIKLDE